MSQKPNEFIPTRESLLSRIKDWEDHESWREFFEIYRKLIWSMAMKSGLTEHEAEEVLQETMLTVARAIKEFQYDRSRCAFKSWLGRMTQMRINDCFRKRARKGFTEPWPEDTSADAARLECVPDLRSPCGEALWEEEWRTQLLDAAVARVKRQVNPEHYQMFHLYMVRKMPVQQVAKTLKVSVARVYLAKHRVSKLIQKEVKLLESQMS
jgi:RNA polymerase sigma-70 factor (ECF subfamily)